MAQQPPKINYDLVTKEISEGYADVLMGELIIDKNNKLKFKKNLDDCDNGGILFFDGADEKQRLLAEKMKSLDYVMKNSILLADVSKAMTGSRILKEYLSLKSVPTFVWNGTRQTIYSFGDDKEFDSQLSGFIDFLMSANGRKITVKDNEWLRYKNDTLARGTDLQEVKIDESAEKIKLAVTK